MIVSARTRWFAIVTGGLIAVAGVMAFGLGFALFIASFLVAGAIAQERFPRIGRGLMCVGALWLSFWVFAISIFRLREFGSTPSVGAFDPIIFACVALMVVCDGMIVMEEVRIRRSARPANTATKSAPINA